MQKQALIETIQQQTELEAELKQEIVEYVGQFPDELSQEDLGNIDAFLAEVEAGESEVSYLTQSLIDENQKMLRGLENARSEYVVNTAESMKTGLSHLEELTSEPETGTVSVAGQVVSPVQTPTEPVAPVVPTPDPTLTVDQSQQPPQQ